MAMLNNQMVLLFAGVITQLVWAIAGGLRKTPNAKQSRRLGPVNGTRSLKVTGISTLSCSIEHVDGTKKLCPIHSSRDLWCTRKGTENHRVSLKSLMSTGSTGFPHCSL